MAIYGYARVSTANQARYGNSIEDQTDALHEKGAGRIFVDVYTGTKDKRPKLDELLKVLKDGDTVIVTKLDRLARSAKGGIEIIDEIVDKGASLEILNMGTFNNTPTGRLTRTIFLAFAEFERDMIVERTQAGKAVAKQNNPNYKEGRAAKDIDFDTYYEKVQRGELTISEAAKELGIHRNTFARRAKERKTPVSPRN